MGWSDFVDKGIGVFKSIPGVGAEAISEASTRLGAVASYTLPTPFDQENAKYDFKSLTFPQTITSEQQGHYMIININVPVWANNPGRPRGTFTKTEELARAGGQLVPSNIDRLRFSQGGDPSYPDAQQQEALSLPRFTRRITRAIALYVPTPMVYAGQHGYSEIKMTGIVSGLVGNLFNLDGGAQLGGGASGGIPQLGGMPINPRLEVLYANTSLRNFQFEFFFAPETFEESQNMKEIISTLRFYSAPELSPYTAGFTFIPPAEFDIKFYHQGRENTHIPRINTCVLESYEVDYAPGGDWVTFSNGHPVMCRMILKFQELEIVHKLRIRQGY